MILDFLKMLIFPGILFALSASLFYEWIDRKFYAKLQNRVGPHVAGPFGTLQPLADFIKLLSKEDIVPAAADKALFTLAPVLAPFLLLFAIMFLPIAGLSGILSFEGDLVVAVAIMSLYSVIVYVAGQASTSRFASIGAERSVLQLIGYEIPLTLSLISVALGANSLRISDIVAAQAERGFWFILGPQALGFAIFLIAAQAEMERVPFDVPEAEQEIVAGWLVEYSGRRLALFRLSKDLELFYLSGLAATAFLGGPLGPTLPGLEPVLYTVYFVIKSIVVLLLFTVIRGIFARLRIDQVLSFCWKYLVPLSILLVLITRVVV